MYFFWLFWFIICPILGLVISHNKGNLLDGLIFSFFLGPFGLILLAFYIKPDCVCPFCKGFIVKNAIKCKNCGSDLQFAEKLKHELQ
jgi:hypothetical protein